MLSYGHIILIEKYINHVYILSCQRCYLELQLSENIVCMSNAICLVWRALSGVQQFQFSVCYHQWSWAWLCLAVTANVGSHSE